MAMFCMLMCKFSCTTPLRCMIKLYKCLLALLMHKMWIWKTHDINLFFSLSLQVKQKKKTSFPQKMPEEVIKISRNERNLKELFYYSTFLGFCKFRMVKWKHEGVEGAQFSRPRSAHSLAMFIAASKKFRDIFRELLFTWNLSENLSKYLMTLAKQFRTFSSHGILSWIFVLAYL